jgi:hypothetical protein
MWNKWERRDMKEAKNFCNCAKTWEKDMSPNLLEFYKKTIDINYERDKSPEERVQEIENLKGQLSAEDAKRSREFARAFTDKNSRLYKCWNKEYPWDGEYRGNNSDSDVGSNMLERDCKLANYVYYMSYHKHTFEVLAK